MGFTTTPSAPIRASALASVALEALFGITGVLFEPAAAGCYLSRLPLEAFLNRLVLEEYGGAMAEAQKTFKCPLKDAVEITGLLPWERKSEYPYGSPEMSASYGAIPRWRGLIWTDRPCEIRGLEKRARFTTEKPVRSISDVLGALGDCGSTYVTNDARVFYTRSTRANRNAVKLVPGVVVPAGTVLRQYSPTPTINNNSAEIIYRTPAGALGMIHIPSSSHGTITHVIDNDIEIINRPNVYYYPRP